MNLASRRVMEQAGLSLVRTFRQPWPRHNTANDEKQPVIVAKASIAGIRQACIFMQPDAPVTLSKTWCAASPWTCS